MSIKEILEKYEFVKKSDLLTYLPISAKDFNSKNIEVHYLGYYLRWIPQESFYYAVEKC